MKAKKLLKAVFGISLALVMAVSLTACGKSAYQDGNYEGSYVDDDNEKTTVSLEIKDGNIVACEAHFYDAKGNEKDENYEKESSERSYREAQLAVEGMKEYPDLLLEYGNAEDIEAISGATISLKTFQEAVKDALKNAE